MNFACKEKLIEIVSKHFSGSGRFSPDKEFLPKMKDLVNVFDNGSDAETERIIERFGESLEKIAAQDLSVSSTLIRDDPVNKGGKIFRTSVRDIESGKYNQSFRYLTISYYEAASADLKKTVGDEVPIFVVTNIQIKNS